MPIVDPIDDSLSSLARSHRITFGVLITIVLQTVALVGWLVQLRADVTQVRNEHVDMVQRVDRFDREGTRALSIVQQRQNDVIVVNTAQEIRMRELDTKISELQRAALENKFWIEQMLPIIRQYSHPNIQSTPGR